MKKFSIEVTRIGFGFYTIEVEAKNQKEAEEKALSEAGDHEYSEKSAEYEIADSFSIGKTEALALIQTVKKSCKEGENGTWDCSTQEGKKGFLDMINLLDDVMKLIKTLK